VLDTPHGKVPLNRSYVRGRAGDRVVMESYGGELWAEPNPIPDDYDLPFRLPEIELPDEADTIETSEPGFVPVSTPPEKRCASG
jgi:lysine 2,3-aminomutase